MGTHVVLLRGVNLGPRNRVAMPALREALAAEGFGDVRTYVQSGNVVLASGASPDEIVRACELLLSRRFGVDVDVHVRTRDELAEVVRRNPLGDVATSPKRYQVTFLREEPSSELVERLTQAALEPERLAHAGREIYTWHPDGVGRSKLAALLAGRSLGVSATARNWTTVTSLLALADG